MRVSNFCAVFGFGFATAFETISPTASEAALSSTPTSASISASSAPPSFVSPANSNSIPVETTASQEKTFETSWWTTTAVAKTAAITEAPGFEGVDVQLSLQEKWHLTTYTTCVTWGANRVSCGVHEPVLPGGDEIAGAVPVTSINARPAAVIAGVLAVGLGVFMW